MVASDFLAMTELLRQAGAPGEPAELHGQLCGLACSLGARAGPAWLADSLDHVRPGAARDVAREALEGLAAGTLEALDEGDMSLRLLLPGDDSPIDDRAAQLGLWCQGFTRGLARGALPPTVLDAGATGEIVRDFTVIGQAALGAEENLAEAEEAYAELVEFVRVSVQLVFEELHSQRAGHSRAAH